MKALEILTPKRHNTRYILGDTVWRVMNGGCYLVRIISILSTLRTDGSITDLYTTTPVTPGVTLMEACYDEVLGHDPIEVLNRKHGNLHKHPLGYMCIAGVT